MELLAGAFPARFRQVLCPVVETLQDKLGEINDLATAQNHLRRSMKTADGDAEVDHLQRLLAEGKTRLEQLRQGFLQWYTPLFQKALRAEFDELLAASARAKRGFGPSTLQRWGERPHPNGVLGRGGLLAGCGLSVRSTCHP
jgi:hypothetical protein